MKAVANFGCKHCVIKTTKIGNTQKHKSMKSILHKANTRGHADHGWLNSYHSFSFGNYHDPTRMNFGVLRVLNDDVVHGGKGFGTHPHRDMEIVSIPLEGDLQHMDSMGNATIIKAGDVQIMSAGTGIQHSEYNRNKEEPVKFLQIWILPNKKGVAPRYDQISIKEVAQQNAFYQILSPSDKDQGVWIHQDAWFHLGTFDADIEGAYSLKNGGNGVYVFVIDGMAEINGQRLGRRDGLGLWDLDQLNFKILDKAKILLMEVPMVI
jgi:hypothetical protein